MTDGGTRGKGVHDGFSKGGWSNGMGWEEEKTATAGTVQVLTKLSTIGQGYQAIHREEHGRGCCRPRPL